MSQCAMLAFPSSPTPKPAEKLAALAPKIKLDASGEGAEEKKKRLETLPFLLKGHLLELAAACRSGDAAEQLEEMEVGGCTFLRLAPCVYIRTRVCACVCICVVIVSPPFCLT